MRVKQSVFAIVAMLACCLSVWASDVQIQATQIGWTGATANVELRLFLSGRLVTPENQDYPASSPSVGTTTFKWDCTAGLQGQLNIPAVTLPATTNAVGGGRIRWSAVFFNKLSNQPIRNYAGFEYFQLAHYLPAPVTWYAVKNFNDLLGTPGDQTLPYPRAETDQKIAAAITASNPGADPSQTGNAGKVLSTNGSTKSWQEVGANGSLFDYNVPAILTSKTLNTATLNSPLINTPTIVGTVQGNVAVNGTLTATSLFGNGAGITGITGASGGVANIGGTTIGSDTDSAGDEHIALQTQTQTRIDIGSTGVIVSVPLVPNRIAPAVVSPSQITAGQNNYAPTSGTLYRLSTDASRTITGWAAPSLDGTQLQITNRGSNNIVLSHESASSTAANRFTCVYGLDITLTPGATALATYDTAISRWRVQLTN